MTIPVQATNDSLRPGYVWAVLDAEREYVRANLNAGAQPVEEREARLNLIDRALDRLIDGSYGRCALCDGPIERKLLAADPALTVCYACQTGI